jgi:sugar phosphate isomerase/epimerase
MVAGCMNPRSENMSGTKLGSLDEDKRERALNSVRQHVQTALHYGCPVVVIRGCEVEDNGTHERAAALHRRVETESVNEDLRLDVREFVQDVQKRGQKQVEYLCRSLHRLLREFRDIRLAIEPGQHFNDLLGFESVGWVLDDFNTAHLGYWHDTGRIHVREVAGLPSQGEWLESFGKRIMGVHLQDAAGTQAEIPPGSGEVDFKLVASYLPAEAERVVEINSRHGRAEILSAVQFLVDQGF